MPVGRIALTKHCFLACLHAYVPGLGPSEREFTVEGPGEGPVVEIGTPAGCSLGNAYGLNVEKKFGGDVGTFVGDAVGPVIGCWKEKRPPGAYWLRAVRGYSEFHVPQEYAHNPTYAKFLEAVSPDNEEQTSWTVHAL